MQGVHHRICLVHYLRPGQHQLAKGGAVPQACQQRSQQLVTAPCCCHGRSAATSNIAGKAGKQRPASCRLRLLLVRCSKAVKQPGPNRWPVRRGWRYRQRLRVRWTTQRRGAGTGSGWPHAAHVGCNGPEQAGQVCVARLFTRAHTQACRVGVGVGAC